MQERRVNTSRETKTAHNDAKFGTKVIISNNFKRKDHKIQDKVKRIARLITTETNIN